MLMQIGLFFFTLIIISSCQGQAVPEFNENNAFRHLETQCEFGPRVPGTEPHEQCRDYLVETLKKYTPHVSQQAFREVLEPGRSAVCYNIIANFHPSRARRILLCAHWDTRPWADRDPDPANHRKPVLGASDGASGVAILLEIARIIDIVEPNFGVDIVFFDAEDFGAYGNNDSWARGSKYFVQTVVNDYHPEMGILLDLVGDANQQIYIERNSYKYARHIVDHVWNIAEEMGIVTFIPELRYDVYDDHLNLLEIGIPCINIIDFDYQYWHTIEDTPDKCSPQSLGNVGRVVLGVLYK